MVSYSSQRPPARDIFKKFAQLYVRRTNPSTFLKLKNFAQAFTIYLLNSYHKFNTMKSIRSTEIPNHTNFQDFCNWYLDGGPYFMVNGILKTIQIAPDSTETIIFKHKCYQVELYLIAFNIPRHIHPKVSTKQYVLAPGGLTNNQSITPPGGAHGGGGSQIYPTTPYYIYVLQHWPTPRTDHISLYDYIGRPLSQNHVALMRTHNPLHINNSGNWIDTTQTLGLC